MIVGASNHLPEDESLQALFDRFLIRVRCDYVDPALLTQVLDAGWNLEKKTEESATGIRAEDVVRIQSLIGQVDLQDIRPAYLNLIEMLRNAGVLVSDRRAVKLQRLIAASALLCKRDKAILSDMWVLRYIWDTEEQREVITGIVNNVIATDIAPDAHPRALESGSVNADDLYREVQSMTEKWDDAQLPLAERTVIKDRLRYLSGRCQWISNDVQRQYVQTPIDALWQKIIHSIS
jgi:MoxR-like ATPase